MRTLRTLLWTGLMLIWVTILVVNVVAQDGDEVTDADILPITEDVMYTVRPSDTIQTVAALFDVGVGCLAEMNDLQVTDRLTIGQELVISVSCPLYEGEVTVLYPREVVTYVETCEGYRVRPLDTLDVIGQTLNVSAVSLQVANDLHRAVDVRVGMCLMIPENAPPYGVYPSLDDADAVLESGGGAGELYVVQPNDTIDTIALSLDVSAVSIQVVNNITNSRAITAGTTLFIPADAPPYGVYPALDDPDRFGVGGGAGELYVVQPNDTIDTIAQELNVSAVSIQVVNNITNSRAVTPGMTLFIPADAPPYGVYPALDEPGEFGGGAGELYVVQPRDTLDLIGALHNADVTCIAEANELGNPGLLQAGQSIFVPADCPAYSGDFIPPLSRAVTPVDDAPATDESSSDEGE